MLRFMRKTKNSLHSPHLLDCEYNWPSLSEQLSESVTLMIVFAPDEELALQRLGVFFERLKAHNLKLSQRQGHFMKRSVKFLGHIVSSDGVSTDADKVQAIVDITKQDFIESSTDIPSQFKIRSVLGMVVFYQQFIEGCSHISKPHFNLTSGMKKPQRGKGWRRL